MAMKTMYYVSLDANADEGDERVRELTRKANENMLNQNFAVVALYIEQLEARIALLERNGGALSRQPLAPGAQCVYTLLYG
ncbi:MAG: hypothetical protein Q4B99_02205 [Clostridia bacterium]|nr:hypothetical protein [Clostridia bacterium]